MSEPTRPDDPGDARPDEPWRRRLPLLLSAILLLVMGALVLLPILSGSSGQGGVETLTYSAFLEHVDTGQVEKVTIDSNGHVDGTLHGGKSFVTQVPTAIGQTDLMARLESGKVTVEATGASGSWWSALAMLLPLLLLVGLFLFLGRGAAARAGAMGGVGRSRARVVDTQRPTTRFSDVAGYEGVKREVAEVIEFLRSPDRYRLAGAVGPRGVLMLGPPGTGKTLLARAIAGEADVPFLTVTGSEFVEMFVGVGAARVRDLFEQARRLAPVIVFIDEVDALGSRRGGGQLVANDEREQTVNQLLAEMDGFDPSEGIVVLAATNRPDVLDPALLRPGRFDRQVVVPLPNLREREAILHVHCRGKHLDGSVDLTTVARGTPGFSGADLANLANEAAIFAVRDERSVVSGRDFDEARDRILLGRRDESNVLLPEERDAVAVHEAGHALVAALSELAEPVAKVTILPAGQSLGATEQLPADERHLFSEAYLETQLAVALGGRAAELVVFGEGSSGAANDLTVATDLATRMVREFGLSTELGPVGYAPHGAMYLGRDEVTMRSYSEATQRAIDQEVARLVRQAEVRATALLAEHRSELDRLAAMLREQETVEGDDVYALAGRRPTDAPARTRQVISPQERSAAARPGAARGRTERRRQPRRRADGSP